MKVQFHINYNTNWGEILHVIFVCHNADGSFRTDDYQMNTDDGSSWTLDVTIMESVRRRVKTFAYSYVVENQNDEILRREWNGDGRKYDFNNGLSYIFYDQWQDCPIQYHLYSNAYRVTTKQKRILADYQSLLTYRKTLVFSVTAPQLQEGQSLALLGNHPAIGGWNEARYLKMIRQGEYKWVLSVNADSIQLPLEYKFVVIDDKTRKLVMWEEGDNRCFDAESIADGQVVVLFGEQLRVKERLWRLGGVVAPLFSLRSEHSYGVGDFGDIIRIVDWMNDAGLKVLQLLPINDTTSTHGWTDSYPYNSISVFALHPHYMDLEQLGEIEDVKLKNDFHRQQRELNALDYSDYMAVDRVKESYIDHIFTISGETVLSSDDYRAFYDDNKDWLKPYAAYSVMRDKYGTADFSQWKELNTYSEDDVDRICSENSLYSRNVKKTFFTQYELYRQLKRASDYARSKGIILKADLQIGVNRHSVATWCHPEYFNLDMQTGTPPEGNNSGCNWEFPSYCWEAMEHDGYKWWKRRFSILEKYFDAIRIDHILGFFRIWEIPNECVSPSMGHFSPALPFNEEEISYFGLHFRKELFTRPFINDNIINKIFGIHASFVKENYLERKPYNLYGLRPEYSTQVAIMKHFEKNRDENSLWIKEGLMKLVSNVLFVEDTHRRGMYHPRVGALDTYVMDVLSDEEKDAYTKLYNNYFYRRHNDYWRYVASKRLSAILSDNRMLVSAEDLGMLPDCVPAVLDQQRILSLRVQWLPKQKDVEFDHIGAYPYWSVATITTHDMPSMRLWWEESPERTQRYYVSMMQKEGSAPRHLTIALAEEIIARNMYSPSMLCLISIQDLLAMDTQLRSKDIYQERINTPSDSYNRWQYRMPLTIEKLSEATMFNRKLNTMIQRSRRMVENGGDKHE